MVDGFGVAAARTLTQGGLSLLKPPLSRAERTPEVVAVSGVYRESRGEVKTLPGIPRTNLSQDIWQTIVKAPDTGEITIDQVLNSYYLDCIAKVENAEAKSCLPFVSKNCGRWVKIGQCENGHRFAVKLNCRKQPCELCRDIEHHKKIASLLPEVQQQLPAALITIRPHNDCQVFVMKRYARRRFIKVVIHALKSLGYRRGIIFIHLFGDDKTRYAFHLHVLVDGGWLEPEELDELCRKLRRMIYPVSWLKKWGDSLIVNYHYKPTQGQIYQSLEYCTRPTFTQLEGNEWLADSIRGEHLVRRWGKWDEEPKWQLAESDKKLATLVSLEKGKCPICGKPIKWDKGVTPFAQVEAEGGVEITTGYLILPTERPPPVGRWHPSNLTELPDGDYRKHPNHIRKEIDRARELISRRHDYEFAS
ncbi:hypothetical protein ES705_33460 [subsurface metagenome]